MTHLMQEKREEKALAVKDILLLGNPKLYEKSLPVEKSQVPDLVPVIQDLHDTLMDFRAKYGAGRAVAAPQIGVQKRIIVCGLRGAIKTLINPEIVDKRGMYANSEYCLSLPQYERKIISRSQYVRVKYKTLENKEKIISAQNSYAALLEHEIDHLKGVLYIDYA